MGCVDNVGAVEVGDGLGDFDDFEIGAGGEIELFRGVLKNVLGGVGEAEQGGNLVGGKGGVEDAGVVVASALAV